MGLISRLHFMRGLIAVLAIMAGLVASVSWLINRPETLKHALSLANLKSKWQIDVQSLKWEPLKNRLTVSQISASNEAQGKKAVIGNIDIEYRLFGLLRGKLVFGKLNIDDVDLVMPRPPREPSPRGEAGGRKRIDITKLVLIKNIEIENGTLRNICIKAGNGLAAGSDEALFSLKSDIFSRTMIRNNLAGFYLQKNEKNLISSKNLSLSIKTDPAQWTNSFPFIDATSGEINVSDIMIGELSAKTLSAKASYKNGNIGLRNFLLTIGEHSLTGNVETSIEDSSFDISIAIPGPISLPFIVRKSIVIDTGGALSGNVKFTGHGFAIAKLNGKGKLDLNYRFNASPDAPVSFVSGVTIVNGLVNLENANIHVLNDALNLNGTIDLKNKNMKFSAKGSNFPVERVFDKFINPNLKKIFGPADIEAAFEGWGKKFKSSVSGTVVGGGWKPVIAEKININLDATYETLKLTGDIFGNGRKTGNAELTITYGARIDEYTRSKKINFKASIDGHPLDYSLAAWGLAGAGSGDISIEGPHTGFRGQSKLKIDNGSWHGIPFESLSAIMGISRHEVVFSDMVIGLPKSGQSVLDGKLTGDIGAGNFRLHGTPRSGLSIDTTYHYTGENWTIKDISWKDPSDPESFLSLSGTLSPKASVNLKTAGTLNLGTFSFIAPLFRAIGGYAALDASIRGVSSNPEFFGKVNLQNAAITPRGIPVEMEDINGLLKLEGNKIVFDNVGGKVENGSFKIAGDLTHKGTSISSSSLKIDSRSMVYRSPDNSFKMEFDGLLDLIGDFPRPILKGNITILDGKYTKDFNLIDAFGGKFKGAQKGKDSAWEFDPRLELKVKNSGDLAIKNNVGDIWLNLNADIKGTRLEPTIAGSITTSDGKIHYLGLEFDITRGFVEFRERYEAPYMEVYAERELGAYNVNLLMHGKTDNLALDLSATSPAGALDKRDVISLLMFGATEQERAQAKTGGQVGSSLVGQAVTGIVGQPILKLTRLDVFRLEAGTSGEMNISRIYFGKQISDRLSVNFATDINTANAVQTFIAEYLLTDNLLIKGSRASDSTFRFSGGLRFRLR